MLADTAEAAVRAGTDRTTEQIEKKVRELVNAKIEDGQLNETPLRFVDVTRIIETFAQVLNGVYHQRIEYPKLSDVAAKLAPSRPPQRLADTVELPAENAAQAQSAPQPEGGASDAAGNH